MIYEKLREVKSPQRAHAEDSGIDFFIPKDLWFISVVDWEEKTKRFAVNNDWKLEYEIAPGESVLIPLGIKIELEEGFDLTFTNRSSIASKKQLIVGACLIDNPYRGELLLNLINVWNKTQIIREEDKIVQGVIRQVYYDTPKLWIIDDKTERGEGWFGSTGF